MRVEILGQERRRQKLDIVMSVGFDGASVTEVADRYDGERDEQPTALVC